MNQKWQASLNGTIYTHLHLCGGERIHELLVHRVMGYVQVRKIGIPKILISQL